MLSILLMAHLALGAEPATVPPAAAAVEIRVGTYNVWGLPGPLTTPRWRARRDLVSRALRALDLDVLGGQEVFRNAVGDLEPAPDLLAGPWDAGLGLWLGAEIEQHGPGVTHHFRARRGVERLKRKGVHGAALTLTGGAVVQVYNTHLQAYPDERFAEVRTAQVAELLALVDARPGPVILLGDFNLRDGHPPDVPAIQALLDAGFRDVAVELERTAEGTYADVDRRLDRIYLRDGAGRCLEALEYGVQKQLFGPEDVVSDHHPVWARVRVASCGG